METQAVIRNADLSGFDLSDDRALAHWRGFTKYLQPDGRVVGIHGDAKQNLVAGPADSGREVDLIIAAFYSRD